MPACRIARIATTFELADKGRPLFLSTHFHLSFFILLAARVAFSLLHQSLSFRFRDIFHAASFVTCRGRSPDNYVAVVCFSAITGANQPSLAHSGCRGVCCGFFFFFSSLFFSAVFPVCIRPKCLITVLIRRSDKAVSDNN